MTTCLLHVLCTLQNFEKKKKVSMIDYISLPYRVLQQMVRARRRGTSDIKLNSSKAALGSWLRSRLDVRPTVFEAFTDISMPEHNSGSKSIILMARLDGKPVVIKAFFGILGMPRSADNSLAVEQYIYSRVVPNMLKHTRNIVSPIRVETLWNFQADRDLEILRPEIREKFRARIEQLKRRKDPAFDFGKLHLVVTKKMEGRPLMNWFDDFPSRMLENERTRFIKDVLLQVACTLLLFRRFRLMHNDLHPGNIFVHRLNEPHRLRYMYTDKRFVERDVRYYVKIYDFDRATVRREGQTIDNMKLAADGKDHCAKFGECNSLRPLFDWFRVLWFMYKFNAEYMNQTFSERILKHEVRELDKNRDWRSGKRDAWHGAACLCPNQFCYPCEQIDLRGKLMSEEQFVTHYYTTYARFA